MGRYLKYKVNENKWGNSPCCTFHSHKYTILTTWKTGLVYNSDHPAPCGFPLLFPSLAASPARGLQPWTPHLWTNHTCLPTEGRGTHRRKFQGRIQNLGNTIVPAPHSLALLQEGLTRQGFVAARAQVVLDLLIARDHRGTRVLPAKKSIFCYLQS